MNHRGMQGSRAPSWRVLVDFDGATDRLFERFTDPAWRAVEPAWQGREASSRECLERQAHQLVTPEALGEQSRTVRIAPGFPAFMEFCRRPGGELKIVLNGLDRVVSAVLRSARLSVPSFTNKPQWQDGDRWRLAFWYAQGERSDFCMSMRADYVIAKRALANKRCARELAHASFADLNDATACLSAWLASTKRASSAVTPLARVPAEP
jgi:2-hydroxy-3-keto-5-methylthiopentenyl-1-phosphate phosphatase